MVDNHLLFGEKNNINQRSGSPFNLAEDDLRLGNLNFVPKGEEDKVFGIQIPKEVITDNIRNVPYYNAYLEMVAKHDDKMAAEEQGKKKSPLKLIDEDEEVHHEPEPQGEGEEYDLERAIQMSLESFHAHGQAPVGGVAIREPVAEATRQLPVVEGKGKGIATYEQAALSLLDLHKPKKKSTTNQYILHRRTPATKDASTGPSTQPQDNTSADIVPDTSSSVDAETGADTDVTTSTANTEVLYVKDARDEDVSHIVALEEKTAKLDEGQAGSDPGKIPNHGALAGPNPEPMQDEFVAIVYPKVHESLKHITEEHVHLENPLSSSGTLSSIKNLDDAFTIGDQFLNDKPTEEDPSKTNMDTKAESMVTVPIHQASTLVPPLSTPIIDLSPPKPVSSPLQEPFIAATTKATTTTLPLPPPPQQQSITNSVLAARVSALERNFLNMSRRTRHLKTRLRILDPIFSCWSFEIFLIRSIKQSMKFGSHKAHPDHASLYHALEISIERDNQEALSKIEYISFIGTLMEECHFLLTDRVEFGVNPEGHQHCVQTLEQTLAPRKGHPDSKERRNALSISKLKAANYLDFRLKVLVSSLWIKSEHEYDIITAYGITHWKGLKRQKEAKTIKKPTRNEKDKNKSEESARNQKSDQPDTARNEVKSQNKVKGSI
ncbi:hypothetical protein Tco_0747916 [Tanacetum coccineum]|uniref:Histone deacetylase 14 n=1 Tax=Tanacetum coccineum TaxID=301880 RepID=A0ABQ4YUD2_9ASTR